MANSVEFRPDLAVVQNSLRGFARRMGDRSVPNARVGTMLDRWGQDNFRSEGGKVGGWESFKIGGRRTGRGIDTSAKLLQDTGRLRASFQAGWDSSDVRYGSDMIYSQFHEFGTRFLPIRRMLPHEGDVMSEMLRIYDEWVYEKTGEKLF